MSTASASVTHSGLEIWWNFVYPMNKCVTSTCNTINLLLYFALRESYLVHSLEVHLKGIVCYRSCHLHSLYQLPKIPKSSICHVGTQKMHPHSAREGPNWGEPEWAPHYRDCIGGSCVYVCLRPYTVNFKWAYLNISWRLGSFVHAICPARCRVGKGLLPECSVGVKEARGTKTTQVNARMTTTDHDRQGQAAHRE